MNKDMENLVRWHYMELQNERGERELEKDNIRKGMTENFFQN